MNDTRSKFGICIFLVVATFCVYSPVQDYTFINYDDDIHITNNLRIQAGLTSESISWAFTTFHAAFWFPVTWISHIIDYQLFGMNPKGYHLANLFFHIANVLLLFIVLHRMTGALWQSSFVAAMFAFHPLNVESVAWLSERKNLLSTFFGLLTIYAYTVYVSKKTIRRWSLVFLFFTLSLMSKSMLVTLPFVFLLLDYWPLKRLSFQQERRDNVSEENNSTKRSEALRLLLEKLPFFLLTIGFSIVTLIAQKSFRTMEVAEHLTFFTRLTNALVSYLEYLKKMIWPEKLAIFYAHPENTLSLWQAVFCGIALVGITIISIKLIRKAPYFAVGWFWYLGTLVPVIGIVQVGGQAMADHFTYVPLIGIFIIVAWGVPELISNWHFKEMVLSVSAGIIIFTLLIITLEQVSNWKNSITIFKHTISVTDKKYPNLAIIHNNLGIALFAEGNNEEAISHYKMAIKLKPTHTKAYYNLGISLFAEGNNEEAISYYKMAIKLNPYFTNAYYNLGIVLVQKGEMKEAVDHFREALRLEPDLVIARDNLEFALLRLKEIY